AGAARPRARRRLRGRSRGPREKARSRERTSSARSSTTNCAGNRRRTTTTLPKRQRRTPARPSPSGTAGPRSVAARALTSRDNGDMRRPLFAAAVLAALVLGSGRPGAAVAERSALAATGTRSAPCGTETRRPRRWKHVVWLWMENASYEEIVGSSSARYLTQLARQCGLATN